MKVVFPFLVALALLAGCSPTGQTPEIRQALRDYVDGEFGHARDLLEPYARETNEDYALNNVRLGSVDLADYDLEAAESRFYKAYEVMNSVRVNSAGRAASAAIVQERFKIWKGEPYERAMASFYLGLVYYIKRNYANARGAFENALFKLRDYGEGRVREDEYREVESDFTIAYLMLGRCWQRLGEEEKAKFAFDRAGRVRADLRPLVDAHRDERNNVLLVVDYGMGPQKLMQWDNSLVTLAPHPSVAGPIPPVQVVVDGKALDVREIGRAPVDLLALAQERRWQDIDTIRVVKSAVGTGLMVGGAYEASRNYHDPGVGLGLIAAGALLKASATADLRHWELLPRTVFLVPLWLPPGKRTITVNVGYHAVQTWRDVTVPRRGEATVYLRINGLRNTGPFRWSPAKDATVEEEPAEPPRREGPTVRPRVSRR